MREDICRFLANRPVPITPSRLATSQISGEWTSPYTGKGMDFRSHRAYQLGDDPRSINMAMSVRAKKRMVVERIATRDISVFILLDCSPSMGIRDKAMILKTIALMILYSASMMEMRVGAAILNDNGYSHLGLGMGTRHTLRMMDIIEELCDVVSTNQPLDYEITPHGLHKQLPAGCILMYISDWLDRKGNPIQQPPFMANSRKFDLVPVIIQDEFEFSFPKLPGNSMLELGDAETGEMCPLWLDNREVEKLKRLNENRFERIQEGFHDRGLNFIHVSNPQIDLVHQSLSNYFLYR
ncbi:MAG: DUF58 domain-containing protein [Gammaproteobacteria bacterium]|nr:DUF58 domain-containing protein [Gammaproteobacteria bacterium]